MSPRNSEIEHKALQRIFNAEQVGILQSDLWKGLGLSSREGSRLAQRFEEKGIVERRRVLHEGRWTYKLYSKRQPVSLSSIQDNPCLSCEEIEKCFMGGSRSPIRCSQLDGWIQRNVAKATA